MVVLVQAILDEETRRKKRGVLTIPSHFVQIMGRISSVISKHLNNPAIPQSDD